MFVPVHICLAKINVESMNDQLLQISRNAVINSRHVTQQYSWSLNRLITSIM